MLEVVGDSNELKSFSRIQAIEQESHSRYARGITIV